MTTYDFTAPLWRWEAKDEDRSGAWFFVSLPFDVSDEIEAVAGPGEGLDEGGSATVRLSLV